MNAQAFSAGAIATGILFLSGCTILQGAVPENYTGPTAVVMDTCTPHSFAKWEFFMLDMIEDRSIRTSLIESNVTKINSDRPFAPPSRVICVERPVPAVPGKLVLKASHWIDSPTLEIGFMLAGNILQEQLTIDFTPLPGRKYAVKGMLEKEQTCLWLEDENKVPVTRRACVP